MKARKFSDSNTITAAMSVCLCVCVIKQYSLNTNQNP